MKIRFCRSLVIFKIFVNIVIQKFPVMQYTTNIAHLFPLLLPRKILLKAHTHRYTHMHAHTHIDILFVLAIQLMLMSHKLTHAVYIRRYIYNILLNCRFRHNPAIVSVVCETEEKVMSGVTSPGYAADQLLSIFLNQQQSDHQS